MIHYISIWGENNLGRKLAYSPAGLKKAKYVVEVLSRIDKIKIGSFASGGCKWNGIYCRSVQNWTENIDIEYCWTFGSSSKYLRMLERLLNILQMLVYLLKIPKHDIVVFYHERYFRHAIKILRFFKTCPKLVYQVEELYTYAGNHPQKMIDTEIESIKQVDAYILVNDLISSILQLDNSKPSCISYGPYVTHNVELDSKADARIHVVYAGIIDRIKRGAEMAVKACAYLPENYCVHIAGFGKEEDVNYLTSLITSIRAVSKCEIIYEGYLTGKNYDNLMSKCSIGLSTQVSGELKYSDTSFPSKVINYLSYGLTVVSTKIKVLEICKVSDLLSFYTEDDPKAVAKAIVCCPLVDKMYAIHRINELNNSFERQITKIIQCLRK